MFVGYFLFINLIGLIICVYDKRCAIKGKWRVPERRLFFVSAIGGALGFYIGMYLVRHKTKHWYFKLFIPMLALLQTVLLLYAIK